MRAHLFFDAERTRFFRPLNSARRELVAACLRTLYERLHGPSADYAHNLNREDLKDLLMPEVQAHQARLDVSGHPTTSSHRALERGSYVSM